MPLVRGYTAILVSTVDDARSYERGVVSASTTGLVTFKPDGAAEDRMIGAITDYRRVSPRMMHVSVGRCGTFEFQLESNEDCASFDNTLFLIVWFNAAWSVAEFCVFCFFCVWLLRLVGIYED